MLSSCRIRHYLTVSIICLIIAVFVPGVRAQLKVFAKVEPNANTVNNSAETYNSATGTFTPSSTKMTIGRESHTATLLRNGKVLIAGGYNGSYLASAEIYDPAATNFVSTTGVMAAARSLHASTLLQDGRVFIVGGYTGGAYLDSAELYDTSADTFAAVSNVLTSTRSSHTVTLLSDGKVLIAGGYNASYLNTAEIYDPTAGTFTATTGTMNVARANHTATLLTDGKVLLAGGQNGEYLDSAEIYDPSTGKFTAASNSMTAKRYAHTATLLPGGKILIAGGYNGSFLNSADIYDPSSSRFTVTTGAMTSPRQDHAAALLPNGKVLISGGFNGSYLSAVELYDPASGTFAAQSNPMTIARELHSATVLPDGKVLLAGGQNSKLLVMDVNLDQTDNVSPNIVFSADSKVGFVAYSGSGIIIAFSPTSGEVLKRIETGGKPVFATPLKDGQTIAFVSVSFALSNGQVVPENRIFLINMQTLQLKSAYTFTNAVFGFGSIISLSPDGNTGYVSSPGTGEVIRFNVGDGKELNRLTGLQGPQQITVSKDGAIIIVVDAVATELVFADSTSMTRKYTFKPKDKVSTAALTIFNKAVLAPDGSTGILACQDTGGSASNGKAFIFKTSTGEILDSEDLGPLPGFTGLTPNGQNWVVLNEMSLSLIPSYDPAAKQDLPMPQGDPIGSANIVFSPDSKFAFYASSANDLVFQHNLIRGGVVGQILVGDNPNKSLEQPSSVAITPDGKTVAVLEFVSNNIDLLTSVTTLEAAKYVLSGNQFTGISLINLSNQQSKFTLTVLDNYGQVLAEDGLTNPVDLTLGPNAQISKNLSEIFTFDISTEHIGRLTVTADQPQVAGYLSVGEITATWLGYYLNKMDGAPLFSDQLYDWVVPEIYTDTGQTTLFDVTSANYTQETYDVKLYSRDGTLSQEKNGNLAYPTNRLEQQFTDLFTVAGSNKVLIAGGQASSASINTAESYDVSAKTFSTTGTMTATRLKHAATLLFNGKVLITGGKSGSILSSAETYDIAAGTFTATTGAMSIERYRHTATLLASGKVLITGGQNSTSVNNTAEIYDPSTSTFAATAGTMTAPRDAHTATLLPSGKVLIAGGINGDVISKTAELYDPATGQFKLTGNMMGARVFHTATRLADGHVLLAGGYDGNYLNTADLYDPATGTFTATGSMVAKRQDHTATLMPDGGVLITGGKDSTGALTSAELYDPATNTFKPVAGAMTAARTSHTATLLPDDKVLIAGGVNSDGDLTTADLYNPDSQSFEATGALTEARDGHTATLLQAGGQGYLRMTCPQGVLFTEFYGTGKSGAMLNGINVEKFIGVKSLYSPQFANVSGFKSRLNLINANTDVDGEVTIILHAANGKVLGTPVTLLIPRNAQIQDDLNSIFEYDSLIQNSAGWLEVNSSVDRIVGTITFTDDNSTYLTSFELSGTPLSQFVFPMAAEDGMYQTGVALLNSNTQPATVTMELWGPGGTLDRTTTFTLASGSRTAQYLGDFFPKLDPRLVGNIRIRSNKPLHSFALVNDRSLHFIAAVPAIPFSEAP